MKDANANHRNTDAEYGIVANGDAPLPSTSSSSSSLTSRRLPCLLALVAIVVAFEIAAQQGLSGAENDAYEPLVVGLDKHMGGTFYNGLNRYSDNRSGGEDDAERSFGKSHLGLGGGDGPVDETANPPLDPVPVNKRGVEAKNNVTQIARDRGVGGSGWVSPAGKGGNPATHPQAADGKTHPRVACFVVANGTDSSGCVPLAKVRHEFDVDSIPRAEKSRGGKGKSSSGDYNDPHEDETDECKLSDPSYQALPAAPSTCNDVHALGFRFGPTGRRPMSGINDIYLSRHEVKYLTSGGFRSVWTLKHLYDPPGSERGERRVIMKTNRGVNRGWGSHYLDQNRRDVLISERAGNSPNLVDPNTGAPRSNVLPVYQYCAFSSVVPFATAGVLDDYMYDNSHRGRYLSAEEQYDLALQAARGLYQAQLYHGGKATTAHADVKPPQFLLFDRGDDDGGPPVMQLNDFNRGQFLTRDAGTNGTCPFRMCHVRHKGSLYRSPEEYMKCADQSDRIDVFSLGGVFFYILSDGRKPWYHVRSYDEGVKHILGGEKPRLPGMNEYEKWISEERVVRMVRERSRHPLFTALKEVMTECWAFEPRSRPSSLRVVRMLEEKYDEIQKSNGSLLKKRTKNIKGGGGD